MPTRIKETEKRLPRLYWKVDTATGMFARDAQDEQGKKTTERVNEIEGRLGTVFVIEDKGNEGASVDPHMKVALTLFDEEAIHQIAVRSTTNFAYSLASRMESLTSGDSIRVSIRQGTRKKNAAFANIEILKPTGNWVEVAWKTMPENLEEKRALTLQIFADHPAKGKAAAENQQAD